MKSLPPTSPPGDIPALHFSTDDLPAADRLEVWRTRVAGFSEAMVPKGSDVKRFGIRSSSWNLGGMVMVHASFGPRVEARTLRKLRADGLDHYRLYIRLENELHVDADGGRLVVRPDDAYLVDMARPETYASQGGSGILLTLPRDHLDRLLRRQTTLHGHRLHGPLAALLTSHVKHVLASAPTLTHAQAAIVSGATSQLLAAALLPALRTQPQARDAIDFTLQRHIRQYIDQRLLEDDLSAGALCKAFHISRASLYRIMNPFGGVASYIGERRLDRAHALLSQRNAQPIARLSEALGFSTPAHFSKRFRARFGYSPSDASRLPAPAEPRRPENVHDTASPYTEWLRTL